MVLLLLLLLFCFIVVAVVVVGIVYSADGKNLRYSLGSNL